MTDPESPQPKNMDQATGELLSSSLGKGAKSFGEAIAPAGTHVGKAITDVAKTANGLIRVGLAPFNVIIWGYEQLEKKFIPKVAEKLESIPIEHRQFPSQEIVGPTLEAAKFRLEINDISEMFANLIASSADDRKKAMLIQDLLL